ESVRAQVEVTDAVRSRELQAKYHEAYLAGTGGLAAAPGNSRHDPARREALDLAHNAALDWLWTPKGKATLAAVGLEMPFSNDRVHLQKAGGASTSAAQTTPEDAAKIAGSLDELIAKRGLRPAGSSDSREKIVGEPSKSPSLLEALG